MSLRSSMPQPPLRFGFPARSLVVASLIASIAGIVVAPTADAATLDTRPAPITFVGAPAGQQCPTPAEVSGQVTIAPLTTLTARKFPLRDAAELLLADWFATPAPVVAVCDPDAAAAGRALGPIGGTAKIAPWSDAVGIGRRVRGASHITGAAALRPGDRYTLPPVSAAAVVDVAVQTKTGVQIVRAATPPSTVPQAVTVEGPSTARVVVVSGADGTSAQTPVASPTRLRATVKPAPGRPERGQVALRVKATRGAVIIAVPTSLAYDGRRERAMYSQADVVVAGGSTAKLSVPVKRSSGGGVDVVVLGLDQRALEGARCTFASKRSAEVRCRRDVSGPMGVWSRRHPSWITSELKGKYDDVVGAAYPEITGYDSRVDQALDELEQIPGIVRRDPDEPVTFPDPAPPAKAVAPSTQMVPVAAAAISIDGLSATEKDELLDEAIYGDVQAGDANGDLKPDLLIGAELPRLLMSTAAGTGLTAVDFDTGGDGGRWGTDLDGDGTTDLFDALGGIVLGQRAWAVALPKLVGGEDERGGPGRLAWVHDGRVDTDPVPLGDLNGDGRFELLDAGASGVDAVYSGADLPLGVRVRLPALLQPLPTDPLRALDERLGRIARFSGPGPRGVANDTFTVETGNGAVRLTLGDGLPGRPELLDGSLLRLQPVDLTKPGGLGAASAPLRVFGYPSVVDVDGPSGDLLIRVATRSCVDDCEQTLRVTRAGVIRSWFGGKESSSSGTSTCAFVDDGPDADTDAEVACSVRAGKLPSRWDTGDGASLTAIALVGSERSGAQRTSSLPRLSWNGATLLTASGFTTVRLRDGRRPLVATTIAGKGRKAAARFVVVDKIG